MRQNWGEGEEEEGAVWLIIEGRWGGLGLAVCELITAALLKRDAVLGGVGGRAEHEQEGQCAKLFAPMRVGWRQRRLVTQSEPFRLPFRGERCAHTHRHSVGLK